MEVTWHAMRDIRASNCMRPMTISSACIQTHKHIRPHFMSIPHASTHDIRSLQLHKDVPISLQHITVDGGNNTEKLIPLILADVDAVMQMYIDAGKGDRDPYWTIPWPSSIAMAQELLAYRPDLVKNKRVADLGCGLGVGGLAAALSEADDVVFLDREPLALQCALINSYMNGFSIEKERNEEVYDSVHTLIQCQSDSLPEDVSKVLQLLSRDKRKSTKISSFVFDWSQPNNLKPFDVVLACDVLYESFSVEVRGLVCVWRDTPYHYQHHST